MRKRRRRIIGGGTVVTLGSQLLSLSLFIMLLAFFIVLNAISSYEQTKVNPVVESISYAFASRLAAQQGDDHPSTGRSDETSSGEGDVLERMEALFTAEIPGAHTVVSQGRGEMYVRMPFDELEAAVIAAGRSAGSSGVKKTPFLPTLVGLMKSDAAGRPYRMDMLLNIDANPAQMQNEKPGELGASLKRISRIAQRLESAGLSPRLISAGVQKGKDGTVELLFRRHIPFNPLGEAHDQP